MISWHWLKADMHAGSGREKAWTVGEERTSKCKVIKLCKSGYHSSPTLFDALAYAPGTMACIVEISEPEGRDETKFVSRTRKLLAAVNVEKYLRQFACDCAERACIREREKGREPDARSWAAIEAARACIRGEITPEELSAANHAANYAAYYAANSAANYAAYSAAYSAAHSAANYAAYSAANSAANSAAYSAANYAAYSAARSVERAWQRTRFDEVVLPKLEAASRFAEVSS